VWGDSWDSQSWLTRCSAGTGAIATLSHLCLGFKQVLGQGFVPDFAASCTHVVSSVDISPSAMATLRRELCVSPAGDW